MSLPINRQTPFFEQLYAYIDEYGGMFNAHLHLDRALSMNDDKFSSYDPSVHVSLHEKHHRIADIHASPTYDKDNLTARVNATLDMMVACKTRRADTMVDVSNDRVGLSALHTLREIKEARASEIELNIAAYTPFGFTDNEPRRWELMLEGLQSSDFLGFLPEADDQLEYPDHIGFQEHCRRALELSKDQKKFIHVHVDQRNEATESGMEQLIKVANETGTYMSADGEPSVWGVHVISPTTYDEERFQTMVDGIVKHNIGIICCPTAAIGMRQLRPIMSPTDNCFPRVLDYLAAGIHVRIASDNIADACSPSTTADLVDEVIMLSAACRFYDARILAKLACGLAMDDRDRDIIRHHLAANQKEIKNTLAGLR